MTLFSLDFYKKNARWFGLLCVFISVLTWTAELTHLVDVCPYCRTERTVIGILGFMLFFGAWRHWAFVYFASVVGFLGTHVAAQQNFMNWIKVSDGDYKLPPHIYENSFLLSTGALFIIIGQVWLVILKSKE